MVQIVEQDDPFGRIGSEFGRGLAQQIPKEIERKRLSEGLKKFSPELAEAYNIPGVIERPEIAQQVLQYIRSKKQREAATRNQSQSSSQFNRNSADGQQQGASAGKFDRNSSNYLLPDTAEEIGRRAADLSDQTGIPFEESKAIEQERGDKRIAAETAFEGRANLASNELSKYVQLNTQKDGKDLFGDIPGEMLGDYDALVRNDVANGQSPVQAASKRGKELLEIAKARQQVSVEGIKKAYAKSKSESQRVINNIRDTYKKSGRLDLYKSDLVNKVGLTPSFASEIAYPVSDNKSIQSEIKNYNKNPSDSLERISNSLSKNDSLLSIALALEKEAGKNKWLKGRVFQSSKGTGDGVKFLDKIAADRKAGKINLTESQARELGEQFNPNPTLKDIWYTTPVKGFF